MSLVASADSMPLVLNRSSEIDAKRGDHILEADVSGIARS